MMDQKPWIILQANLMYSIYKHISWNIPAAVRVQWVIYIFIYIIIWKYSVSKNYKFSFFKKYMAIKKKLKINKIYIKSKLIKVYLKIIPKKNISQRYLGLSKNMNLTFYLENCDFNIIWRPVDIRLENRENCSLFLVLVRKEFLL